jgi:hypothetical protein
MSDGALLDKGSEGRAKGKGGERGGSRKYLGEEIIAAGCKGFMTIGLQRGRGESDDDDGRFEEDVAGELIFAFWFIVSLG